MGSTNISKSRLLILTVLIGAVLFTIVKLIYPLIDITQTASLVTVIAIITAYIIEKLLVFGKSGEKNEQKKG